MKSSFGKKYADLVGVFVCLALPLFSIVLAIVISWRFWMGLLVLIESIGAFLAYSTLAAFPVCICVSAITDSSLDYILDSGNFCYNSERVLVLIGTLLYGGIGMSLWYWHIAYKSSSFSFWTWIMLSISVGIPFLILAMLWIVDVFWLSKETRLWEERCRREEHERLCAKKRQEDFELLKEKKRQEDFELLKEKWQVYVLGSHAKEFALHLRNFRRQVNLHYAQKCCMRLMSTRDVKIQLVDKYISQRDLKRLSEEPRPSYAMFKTEFVVCGVKRRVSFELEHPGKARLWRGNCKMHEFDTWQDMVDAIDSRCKSASEPTHERTL